MEPDLDIKQAYLRKEILDKKYEPDEFISYFQQTTGLSDFDLERIKFTDLEKVYSFLISLFYMF